MFQKCLENKVDHYFNVKANETINFSWVCPLKEKEIFLQFNSKNYKFLQSEILLDKVYFKKEIILMPNNSEENEEITLIAVVRIEGPTKILSIYEKNEKTRSKKKNSEVSEINFKRNKSKKLTVIDQVQIVMRQIKVYFKNIGISIVQNYKNEDTHEVFYICIKDLEFIIIETKKCRTVQLRILYLNIDNNSQDHLLYPVILTPTNYRDIIVKRRKFFFNFIIEQNLKAETVYFYLTI